MTYEQQLIAAGIAPEQATRDAWANNVLAFRNRELPSYGRLQAEDDADWRAFVAQTSEE